MIIPVRCMGCGKPIGQLWEEYHKRTEAGEDAGKVMDDIGLERYCCRGTMLGQADMLPDITNFKKA